MRLLSLLAETRPPLIRRPAAERTARLERTVARLWTSRRGLQERNRRLRRLARHVLAAADRQRRGAGV